MKKVVIKKNIKRNFLITILGLGMIFALCFTIFSLTSNQVKGMDNPDISRIVSTNEDVTIQWNKTDGAEKYNLYKKSDNNEYEKIATLDADTTDYLDKEVLIHQSYTYYIENVSGKLSLKSSEKTVSIENFGAPKLISVRQFMKKAEDVTQVNWESQKGYDYSVFRKEENGKYEIIGNVTTDSENGQYTDDDIKVSKKYTYTVRRKQKDDGVIFQCGQGDSQGISTLGKTKVKGDFTNLKATLSWDKVEGAQQYKIYRKQGLDGEYERLATVDGNNYEYVDPYIQSLKTEKEKSILGAKSFVDPSINDLIYTVRAYSDIDNKESFGSYYKDGIYNLCAPSITKVDKPKNDSVNIEWCTVKNATNYYVYSGYNDSDGNRHWEKLGNVAPEKTIIQSSQFKVNAEHDYFTVKAVFNSDGETLYSNYDKGFHISDRKYNDKNVLFFGDSITFGSPYKGKTTRTVFSYPWRVQQLTDVNFYNPSIPGSTYTYNDRTSRSRMVQIADCLNKGIDVQNNDLTKKTDMYVYKTDFVDNQIHGKSFKDFDVMIMAAGTNDYLDNSVFGSLTSTNDYELNGALNKIMGYVKTANSQRKNEGKQPMKIVFIDLLYSDRTYDYTQLTNRFITQNKIGFTLTDYQNDINSLIKNYKQQGLDIYQFETNSLVNHENCPYVASDNLHMTRFAYGQIGNSLADYLIKNKII